jgi:hypothetical protein
MNAHSLIHFALVSICFFGMAAGLSAWSPEGATVNSQGRKALDNAMTISRIASVLVVAINLIVGLSIREREIGGTFTFILATVIPLPFIWFPDAFGDFAVSTVAGYSRPTTGVMIAVVAWVFLATVPLTLILLGG